MTPLHIIFTLIIALILIFLSIHLFRLYRRLKQSSYNSTAKNIYVLKYNSSIDDDDSSEAESDSVIPRSKGPNRRRYARTEFHGFVDFINKGTLYKEQARDLSYSGIFIKSRAPEKYKKHDLIVMTFQTDKLGPQRRNGQIARIDNTGIGVNFIP
nr:PilZ domain-containing protein [uncultured Desulfobacter sp.]